MSSRTPAERLLDAVTALEGISDPEERAKKGHDLQEAMKATPMRIRVATDTAVAELRETKSLAEVAELLGVGVKRVSQMATGKHGHGRQPPSLVYAARYLDDVDTWYGDPDALPPDQVRTATVDAANQRMEVRYGPVIERTPPDQYTYITVNGTRLRLTAAIQHLFTEQPARAGTRPPTRKSSE